MTIIIDTSISPILSSDDVDYQIANAPHDELKAHIDELNTHHDEDLVHSGSLTISGGGDIILGGESMSELVSGGITSLHGHDTSAVSLGGSYNGLSVASSGAEVVNITVDEIILSDSSFLGKRFGTISESISMAIVGAGGLEDGSSEAISTWYYVHLIGKSDGTIAGIFSESYTIPTLPTGYTFYALVGAVRNDGSGDFIEFYNRDGMVATPRVQVASASPSSYTAIDLSSEIPPIAKDVLGDIKLTNSGGYAKLASTESLLNEIWISAGGSGANGSSFRLILVESQQIWYKSQGVGTVDVGVSAYKM